MSKITISADENDFNFNVEMDDFNKFINETTQTDKVAPAFNLLMSTIEEKQKEAFKKLVIRDGKPNGLIAMQFAGAVSEEFGGEVKTSLKKPKK